MTTSNLAAKKASRKTWKRNFDFLISILGLLVGLGNVWRFPYLCYKNGGGVFLIPYFSFMVLVAWPIVVLESTLGQFSGSSAVTGWTLVPLMKGIGYFSTVVLFLCNIYYPIILTWALRWFLASFSSVLPWTSCNNTWNTKECVPISKYDNESIVSFAALKKESAFFNVTSLKDSSSEEFWKHRVLGVTSGLEHQGTMNWELLGCLAAIWVLTYFCIWKGIGWTSKIVYVTATLPLVMILVVMIRGVTLPGAENGIHFYLKPNVTKLWEIEIWSDAASQVIYTTTIGSGVFATVTKYNKFNHNFFRDSIILLLANSCASFLAGFAIFSILGYLAEVKNSSVADVVESGPGLVFVAYPTALSLLPLPQLWSAIFFLTLVLLGFDTQFINQESFIGCICDLSPRLYMKLGREKLIAIVCLAMFLPGMSMMMQGGVYIFHMVDQYAVAGWCMFFVVTWECVTIGWMYGADKMCDDIEYMLGYKIPRIWFKICWKYVSPFATLCIMIYSLARYKPLQYEETYTYPIWANVVGWIMALSSMTWIPATAIYQLWKAEGNTLMQKLESSIASPINWNKIRENRIPDKNEEELKLNETSHS